MKSDEVWRRDEVWQSALRTSQSFSKTIFLHASVTCSWALGWLWMSRDEKSSTSPSSTWRPGEGPVKAGRGLWRWQCWHTKGTTFSDISWPPAPHSHSKACKLAEKVDMEKFEDHWVEGFRFTRKTCLGDSKYPKGTKECPLIQLKLKTPTFSARHDWYQFFIQSIIIDWYGYGSIPIDTV